MSESLFGSLTAREKALVVHTQRIIARELWDRFCYECNIDYTSWSLVNFGSINGTSKTPQQIADSDPMECFTFAAELFFLDPKIFTDKPRREATIARFRGTQNLSNIELVEAIAEVLDPVDETVSNWSGRGSNQHQFRLRVQRLKGGLFVTYDEELIRASLIEVCNWLCDLLETWEKDSYAS